MGKNKSLLPELEKGEWRRKTTDNVAKAFDSMPDQGVSQDLKIGLSQWRYKFELPDPCRVNHFDDCFSIEWQVEDRSVSLHVEDNGKVDWTASWNAKASEDLPLDDMGGYPSYEDMPVVFRWLMKSAAV